MLALAPVDGEAGVQPTSCRAFAASVPVGAAKKSGCYPTVRQGDLQWGELPQQQLPRQH